MLSPERLTLLQSIVERYRHAGEVYDDWGFSPNPSRGLVALFAGPSGTGKTLAAEIIAGALGLDVFKLDLSSVVSKYIGETEKNLEQIFDAASAGNMVLFFDEADSLFGKRSEVKDARDRYANIEVSYLLQRLEAYDGLVVLATNFEKNVDEAFLRRIHVRVEFALPGVEERKVIWAQQPAVGCARRGCRSRLARRALRAVGCLDPQCGDPRGLPRVSCGYTDHDGDRRTRRRQGVPQDGPAAEGQGLRRLLRDRLHLTHPLVTRCRVKRDVPGQT